MGIDFGRLEPKLARDLVVNSSFTRKERLACFVSGFPFLKGQPVSVGVESVAAPNF